MKIEINEKESYNVEIPTTLSAQEFLALFERLNNIKKIVISNLNTNIFDNNIHTKILKPRNRIKLVSNRDDVIKLLKLHYFGSKEEKQNFAASVNRDWKKVRCCLTSYKRTYKIEPEEIGLKRFPTTKDSKIVFEKLIIK